MANPELGAKQICPSCQSKFYDLGRRPAVCPKCGESFDPEEAVRNRRVRARSTPADYETEEEAPAKAVVEPDGFEDEADETPEIDDAAAAEPLETDDDVADGDVAPAGGPDIGVDFASDDEDLADDEDDADGVPFLEDEDDFDEDDIEGLPEKGDEDL